LAALLASRVGLPLLNRLRTSPFGGDWLRGARLVVACAEHRLLAATDRVVPWKGESADALLRMTEADLDAMLAGAPPAGEVGWVLGERDDAAPRVMQARAVMALAALGWCGPWPDPDADRELVALTRRAVFDLAVGPADAVGPLFRPGAPPELASVQLRFTDGARPLHSTLGLSNAPGAPEFVTDADPRCLRVAVLHWLEARAVPATLAHGDDTLRFRPRAPLPLPHGTATLVQVGGP
jgi:hypothetical protein